MTSLMTLPTKDSHDHRDMQRRVTIDLELSGAALQVQTDSLVVYTVEWRLVVGRCGGRGARVLAYQPYTLFTSGDEVKFQRGPDYFSVWVNGSVMTVPVDWEADR